MLIDVTRVPLETIRPLRELYRREMNCQIVHDSHHERGFTESYLIQIDGRVAGYGTVHGVDPDPKDVVREFHVLPAYRASTLPMFRRFVAESRARTIAAQTNDRGLTLLLFDCAVDIEGPTILFHDAETTTHALPGATFRKATEADAARTFPHTMEPVGGWLIEVDAEVVATGGILFHYNLPYGDIFMEVAEPRRRRGYGRFLVQELKRVCYEMGRVPAARCQAANVGSRATLQGAGFLPCARILTGRIATLDADGGFETAP